MPARSITLTENLYYVIQPSRIKCEKTSEAKEEELKLIIQNRCLDYVINCPWIAYFNYSNLKITNSD